MTCSFTSFSTVFQLYQDEGDDNERLCAMEPCLCLKIWPRAVLEPRTARLVGQRITHRAAGAFFSRISQIDILISLDIGRIFKIPLIYCINYTSMVPLLCILLYILFYIKFISYSISDIYLPINIAK